VTLVQNDLRSHVLRRAAERPGLTANTDLLCEPKIHLHAPAESVNEPVNQPVGQLIRKSFVHSIKKAIFQTRSPRVERKITLSLCPKIRQ